MDEEVLVEVESRRFKSSTLHPEVVHSFVFDIHRLFLGFTHGNSGK